jgi:hypothetical protein
MFSQRGKHLYQDKTVITVTPAGRQAYLEILVPYLLANRHIIDRHRFWVNTVNRRDIHYIESLVAQYPDFFEAEYLPEGVSYQESYSICHFFPGCCDPNTVYIRFDDDICYIHPRTVENLLAYRLANPEPFLVYPVIVNNCLITHLLQEKGALTTEAGMAGYTCMGKGWRSGPLAHAVHHDFLTKLMTSQVDDFVLPDRVFDQYERVSINCICWMGSDFQAFGGIVDKDEELWLSVVKPKELERPNALCGNALVAHFAFYTQRHYLENNTNDLLAYRAMSHHIGESIT